MNIKLSKGKSLGELFPLLAKQWHIIKNANLTPFDVTVGSDKKVWWKCEKGDDHEWITSVNNRTSGKDCPICSNKKVVLSNCLATTHPLLAKQWHPTKNGLLTPFDIVAGASKMVWWKCDKGKDHEWNTKQRLSKGRIKECPFCSGHKTLLTNSLEKVRPEIAKEWHPTKNNKILPSIISEFSHYNAWWKCEKGYDHVWQTNVANRSKGSGCPYCKNKKISMSNSVINTHPGLINEFHPTKNGNLNLENYVAGSGKLIWWKCDKGDDHEWITAIRKRAGGDKCPICSGHKTTYSNSIQITHPKIAKQWHPIKNGDKLPSNFSHGSNEYFWWKCEKGDDHEWRIPITSRVTGRSNCPYCTLTPQSKQELTITFELIKLFKNINPKGFKTRVNEKILAIDIYIPELNLGIEFDGNYWHKGKRELDKLKTEKLEKKGINIIRVREEPLKQITENDIISRLPFNAKNVTDDILNQILKKFELSELIVSKINNYFLKKSIQNINGLDDYIEKILTEKAINKFNKRNIKLHKHI